MQDAKNAISLQSFPLPPPLPSAVKALRFALAHPSAAASMEGVRAAGSGSHLRLTKSMLAKMRQKAGAGEGQDGGGVQGRVASIDALLLAMRRRLAVVQAALAEAAQEEGDAAAVAALAAGEAEGGPGGDAGAAAPLPPADILVEDLAVEDGPAADDAAATVSPRAHPGSARLREERERRAGELQLRQAAAAVLRAAGGP